MRSTSKEFLTSGKYRQGRGLAGSVCEYTDTEILGWKFLTVLKCSRLEREHFKFHTNYPSLIKFAQKAAVKCTDTLVLRVWEQFNI